jgi:Putative Actinobacterial Holin-X, holin superfamily III
MLEEEKNHLDEFIAHAEEYLKTKQELTQAKVTEKVVVIGSSTIASLILAMLGLIALMFFSLAAAKILSEYFQKPYIGYLLVALFYLLVMLLLVFKRNKWLNKPIMNTMIKKIYQE